MKRVKYLLYVMLLLISGVGVVNAASLSVKASKSTVVVGSTVVVTVSASGADGWEYCIDYDSSYLTLSSSTVGGNGNTSCVLTGGELLGAKEVKFTFKAKKSGSTTVSVKDVDMIDSDGKSVSVSKGSVKLTLKTQAEIEASYSTDANLKSLSVENHEITPAFDKDTLEYELEVENDVESIVIHYDTSDRAAKVSGAGSQELMEGLNKFEIVVTAEKGNKKTYTLNVTRKELNPIKVNVDGKEYTVIRKSSALEAPTYFTASTVVIDDEEVPAFVNEVMDTKLVGLKDEDGNIALYVLNSDGTYRKYIQVGLDSLVFAVMEPTSLIDGYENTKEIDFNGEKVVVYTNSNSEFSLIYGTNVATGDTGWYQYDQKDNTLQRYVPPVSDDNEDGGIFKVLSIVFGGCLGFSIIVIIILLCIVRSRGKKNARLVELIESKIEMPQEEEVKEVPREEAEEVKVVRRDVSEEDMGDETRELNNQFLDLIEREGEDKRKMSAEEAKKEEKARKKKEKEELKEMQDDFLATRENPVIEDKEPEIVVEKTSKRRGRPKKVKEDSVNITEVTDDAVVEDIFGNGEEVIKRSELTEEDITELKKNAMAESIKEKESE